MRLKLVLFAAIAAAWLGPIAAEPANQDPPSEEDRWAAPPPPWEGVWQGTVGNLPVHVCFDTTPYEVKGGYYYDRIKKVLRLEPGKADGEWFEQEKYDVNGAQWRIQASADSITGTWQDGAKTLPLKLHRIGGPSKEYDGPCGSMAFVGPRILPVRISSGKGAKDGVSFTNWIFTPGPWLKDNVEISTFTLNRPGPGVAKVNALLRTILPKQGGTGDWVDCVAGNLNNSSMDGSYYRRIEPTLVSRRWLAAMEYGEYYCGGAHPSNENVPHTYDLLSGEEVDPLDWLLPKAVHREDLGGEYGIYKTLTSEFVAVLLKGWQQRGDDNDECLESTQTQESWNVGIARGALVFTPNFPRVIMACEDDYKISFAELQPWLTLKGKEIVATLPR